MRSLLGLRSLLVAGGVLGALLLLEAVVRQIYWHPAVIDPVLGAVPAPGETHRYATEGDGRSHWSAPGVRRPTPPDPQRASILVFGDSFTEALMIDDADVYTQRLEEGLAALGLESRC